MLCAILAMMKGFDYMGFLDMAYKALKATANFTQKEMDKYTDYMDEYRGLNDVQLLVEFKKQMVSDASDKSRRITAIKMIYYERGYKYENGRFVER